MDRAPQVLQNLIEERWRETGAHTDPFRTENEVDKNAERTDRLIFENRDAIRGLRRRIGRTQRGH
jgi:hypothetical protein